MATETIPMPQELDEAWSAVERADAKRAAVRGAVDELADRLATARRKLASADSKKGRDSAATELAALQAQAGVLPDEYEGACQGFAQALGRWATGALELAEGIERDGNRKARAIFDEEADLLAELAAVESAGNAHPVRYADHAGQTRTARPRRELKDATAIRVGAQARAERAKTAARKAAAPIRRLVQVKCRAGRKTSIFDGGRNAATRRSQDQPFQDATGWVRARRAEAERVLEEAR